MTTALDNSSEVLARQEKRDRLHSLLSRARDNCPALSPGSGKTEPGAPAEREPGREPEYEWEFDFAFDDWYDPRLSWCRRYADA